VNGVLKWHWHRQGMEDPQAKQQKAASRC